MLESLYWQRALNSAEAEAQLHALREDALRLFLALAAVGYLGWHFTATLFWPERFMAPAYTVMLVALPVLVGTYALICRWRQAATVVFVGGALFAIAWAVQVLQAPHVAMLYMVLALMAAFVIHPLGGFVVVGAAAGAMLLLASLRPGLLAGQDVGYVVVFAALAVVGVWALMHHLFLALNWYANSYAEADRRTREAEDHRGQLAQAWQQLDLAYQRLERLNDALELAWRAADEAERSKMELATNLSHEMRTPLNLIIGYSEMMMSSPSNYDDAALPASYRGDMSAIYRSAQHLLALTEDVLDLARLEAGRLSIVKETVDLGQIVREAVALVREYAESKGLELRVDLPSDLPPMALDRLRIRQVLLNLLTNAARLTEHGRISVRVQSREHDVRVEVADTGPGIGAAEMPRVFERFVTRDQAKGGRRGGVGLGLPISKWFVELHGGEMGVDSVPGVGSTFWFNLPAETIEAQAPAAVRAGRAAVRWRPSGQVVVLAHADPELAHLLQRRLEGFQIEMAPDLAAAQALAVEMGAAAILADADAVAADEALGSVVPVVRCSLPRSGRLAHRLGVADYLIKPVSREVLLRSIGNLGRPINRVLIADDDVHFVRLLSRMLRSRESRCSIATAHNGEEALAKMSAEQPDLLLLDLVMPRLDGAGVLSQMAAHPQFKDLKVIVISARGEGEDTLSLGRDLHIVKPEGFRLAELAKVVGAALSQMAPSRAPLAATERASLPTRPG